MQLPSDAQVSALIEAAQHHDEAAFDQLYSLYADAIFHFFRYRCPDHQTAEDLTSMVFLRVVEALPKYQLPAEKQALGLTSWLFRIASNQMNDYYRRNKRRSEVLNEELSVPDHAVEAAERQSDYDELRRALDALTEQQRTVLVLRFVEELDLATVAEITGQQVGGVKSMQHRALKTLARLLSHLGHPAES